VPESTVLEILDLLHAAGLVRLDACGNVLPARSPEQLTLADVSSAVGGIKASLRHVEPSKTSEFRDVEPYFEQGDGAVWRRLSRITWASLVPNGDEARATVRTARGA
jgi:hypothetical protein